MKSNVISSQADEEGNEVNTKGDVEVRMRWNLDVRGVSSAAVVQHYKRKQTEIRRRIRPLHITEYTCDFKVDSVYVSELHLTLTFFKHKRYTCFSRWWYERLYAFRST